MRGLAEPYRAFILHPLPPDPPLQLDAEHHDLIERANRAVGRLDGVTMLLPAMVAIHLQALGIARELTGRRRNRLFAYEGYLAILNERTEPLE